MLIVITLNFHLRYESYQTDVNINRNIPRNNLILVAVIKQLINELANEHLKTWLRIYDYKL